MDDPNTVSPGILGFLAFLFLAVALYFLVRNMNGHLRRVRYRAAELERDEARAAAEAGAEPETGAEPDSGAEPTTGAAPEPDVEPREP